MKHNKNRIVNLLLISVILSRNNERKIIKYENKLINLIEKEILHVLVQKEQQKCCYLKGNNKIVYFGVILNDHGQGSQIEITPKYKFQWGSSFIKGMYFYRIKNIKSQSRCRTFSAL